MGGRRRRACLWHGGGAGDTATALQHSPDHAPLNAHRGAGAKARHTKKGQSLMDSTQQVPDDLQAAKKLQDTYQRLRAELRKIIVGQDEVIEQLLIALFAGGHCLLEGVPGLAKTLMISSLARCLSLSFNRIQFTPDLMPSDITGTEVIAQDQATMQRVFKFLPGPIFANIILADEINRTPPRTQAAMFEAMQDRD